jgi:hypothetical protein
MTNNMPVTGGAASVTCKALRILLWVAALVLLFSLYTWGISQNPPGFFLDESATAYNAYLVSRTGAGEFGPRFPVLFQQYAVSNPTYMNPLAIYLLAIVFRFLHPEYFGGTDVRRFLDVCGVSAAWPFSKAHFWPA